MKKDTWLDSIIEAFEILGGNAKYRDLYPEVKRLRINKGLSWTEKSEHTIQATIEDHSSDSIRNNKPDKKDIFIKINKGHWGLRNFYYSREQNLDEALSFGDEEEVLETILNKKIDEHISETTINNFDYNRKPQEIEETVIKNGRRVCKRNSKKLPMH